MTNLLQTTHLFEPMTLGDYQLKNRMIMAPLTRARAQEDGTPTELMAEYYGQRAGAGLIIAEATAISAQGRGWMHSPGLFNQQHQNAWAKVADSVHKQGGRIFVQLWHMGSTVHPDFLEGQLPVSSSAVKQQGAMVTPKGRDREFVVPRALTTVEIEHTVQDFVAAAKRAIAVGLDGVEIHGANGFLVDQFSRDSINQRDDEYGGSIDNRLRFMLEVVSAVTDAIGAGKVGIRLSPTNAVWGINDSDPAGLFGRAAERLSELNLAYLHLLEPKPDSISDTAYLTPLIRHKYKGTLLINGGYDQDSGHEALANQEANAIVYGSAFIANPDLVERFRLRAELAQADPNTFYTHDRAGYVDYPAMVV